MYIYAVCALCEMSICIDTCTYSVDVNMSLRLSAASTVFGELFCAASLFPVALLSDGRIYALHSVYRRQRRRYR